ncbi:carboxypeptidase-like regulatory domain-containing protein [Flagellimonas algicola]|uniref:carboxypeptidase-like regulatory domain-containing protein n=1 Tax=Flagellimonas algicola TaxID=2583815 RepID=UPI001F2BF83D|nr:carboxypeptidase-like regulatory domain-containing protein [Allomuricauda algicola]
MKNLILFAFLLIFDFAFGQTTDYSGVVIAKSDKTPLPGAIVLVKGTKIGTQTDFDGNFNISVPDSLNTLTISYIGFKTQEIKLDKPRLLEIFLKEDCNICYFDYQDIGVHAMSGVLNNPIGGQLYFSTPAMFGGTTLKTNFAYQTNLKENRFLNSSVSLVHLFMDCGFDLDLKASLRNVNHNNNIDSQSYSFESSINIRGIKLLAGFSTIDYVELDKNKMVKSNGPLVGFGKWLHDPFYAEFKATMSIYRNVSEYQVEVKRNFRRLSTFIRYNKIGGFNEINLGVGYQFNYY